MTISEALEILERDDSDMRKGYFCLNDFEAIEVLKTQAKNIDKMIAEILQLDYNDFDAYEGTSIDPQVSRDDVIDIIKEYCKGAEND